MKSLRNKTKIGKDLSGNLKECSIWSFVPVIKEYIKVYGADNHLRLNGKHETQSIDKFSYGAMDRSASIRISIYIVSEIRKLLCP
jgi:glutamine synthetase